MTTYLVLTAIGDDKPGLVESLAQTIANNAGNWLESNMSQLAGKFAGVLRVSVNDQDADRLIGALEELSDQLTLVIERVDIDETQNTEQTVELNLIGNDRAGIVQEISHALAKLSVNVEKLASERAPAPMSGDALFKASALLKVPEGLNLEDLRSALEGLADDLIVELREGS
ncbi:MAG: ACT domain-containing protein [Gammaproteobacteria bacterium]|jgi:glycine cleavage system regulatory protein|nr:ACT domain-containing protein [Gammaproteobacteria bacterium]MDP6537006.1 ACT domain-containing protein [Gammaproteobacteria bacterium]MDP6732390.1 ACT domain-containing protein [Gammaproteobacteria bacterium]HAJ76314.1 glycine cleavage system protein R [Gammaproteobacteria bacterium]|tara:strand:+ start:758 stop:1273 length:516 start_codon:yes stop_codon:yes gene_type:complete